MTGEALTETFARLDEVISYAKARDMNEADTRHKVIDFILHDFLSWPRNRVAVEEYISPGFADYVLKKVNKDDLLFIEAKKAGEFFQLPIPYSSSETSAYIAIRKLITDSRIKSAMEQVRTYCIDTGCEFACVTNGIEWIFFKTFERGKKWESLQAFVIRNLDFFKREYTKAVNGFSFTAISENASLSSMLSSVPPKDRAIFFPKEKIPSYSHTITQNKLASKLRPIVNRYFGVISDNDTEFMERCYVKQRDYQGTSDGMRALIQDTLSPYFEGYGVQQLTDTGKGGRLGGRLTKRIKGERSGEVLVLFGGKGSGKSTFVKRLLHHSPPRWLREHASIAVIDLLKVPEDSAAIRDAIWSGLVVALDRNKLLASERDDLLGTLFFDRFETAKKQDLAGLSPASEAYNLKLNGLVAEWKADKPYCAERLVERLADEGLGVIAVIDNTDQYDSKHQDFCFSSAQEVSSRLRCATLISMREERFYDSKIHGVLDAFQNAGFHISSPKPAEVFKRRLDYTAQLLSGNIEGIKSSDAAFVSAATKYLDILSRTFSNDLSPLNQFMTACAHGDIRLALDLFRSFLLSGYTNVEEMIASGKWSFLMHQVIRPVMTPNRLFYEERLSDIPNIYQIRSYRNSSHFTSLRILRKLSKGVDPRSQSYFAVSELRAYFHDTFSMVEDFERNLDVLLRHGFVEANNRLDSYSDAVDSIKITSYGSYMFSEMAYLFTYLDLVCTDCGIFSEETSNYLVEAARSEFEYFTKGQRQERVELRIERVKAFIEYLRSEELRERDFYSLGMPESEMFTARASEGYAAESVRVLKSLKRQNFDSEGGRHRRH